LVAAYLLLRANDRASFGLAVAAGACWAAAALVRPEAALTCAGLTLIGVAVVMLRTRRVAAGGHGITALISPGQLARFENAGLHRLWAQFGHNGLLGAPLIVPLGLVGLLGGPWTGRQWMRHGLLVLLGVANAAVFGAIAWYQFRFLLPLIPIALIFAARGCVRLADLASAAWVRNRPQRAPAAALAYLERVAPAVVVVADGVGAPYQSRWATSGLPDGNYRLVQTFNFDANPTVVYERASDT
jgi:hypothetical protein